MSTFTGKCRNCRNNQKIFCVEAEIITQGRTGNSVLYFDCPTCGGRCSNPLEPDMARHLELIGVPRKTQGPEPSDHQVNCHLVCPFCNEELETYHVLRSIMKKPVPLLLIRYTCPGCREVRSMIVDYERVLVKVMLG